MARYLKLSCPLPPDFEERLASVLDCFDVLGSSISATADGSPAADIYLEPDLSREAEEIGRRLVELGAGPVRRLIEDGRDWLADYRDRARPFAVGSRWWIEPSPDSDQAPPEGRLRLVIEPTTAFGSGSHESTQLVLTALEDLPVPGTRVLDIGTGSGILALAADRLGAELVVGVDVDVVAIGAARRTARCQDWPARVRFLAGTAESIAPLGPSDSRFGLILCNMLTGELLPQLEGIRRVLEPGGRVVLAGMLRSERAEITEAAGRVGLRIMHEIARGDWIAMVLGHG
jgi:ribosomal protein L11 methyltransferase